ncbi:MAG: RsmB/NOP family class I SAM-dependent RNA methyltransferase [Alphaproteobacteria bacterium]|nr:RsmB/NOP family class I SAM-dependent RNA methyltransferase [Alphaproteobacteria bacterium]
MKPSARIQAAIELLENLQNVWETKRHAPMDALMNDYFKARRYIGSKDRGSIAELVYFVLRNGGALEWHVEKTGRAANPRRVVIAALYIGQGLSADEVAELFSEEKYAPSALTDAELGMLDRLENATLDDDKMPVPARYNFPDWMIGRLKESFGEDLPEAMEALNAQAPVDLRMNSLKCPSVNALIHELDKAGHLATPTPHSPIGVRLTKRIAAFNTQVFQDGWFEMQDEGSQIVAQLVEAQPGDKVIDFCAGAGGKTLAIAATMKNKGRILAWDTSETRLKQMPKRLARAGVSNVQTHTISDETDQFIKRHKASADWVMVDAPCSGSGTWRRNPDLKWRFTADDLNEVKRVQANILKSAARLVKPAGKLVYVTCSVFQDENINQINQFLGEHPTFRVAPLPKIWNKLSTTLADGSSVLQLSPHKDGTDGFFAAVLTNQA